MKKVLYLLLGFTTVILLFWLTYSFMDNNQLNKEVTKIDNTIEPKIEVESMPIKKDDVKKSNYTGAMSTSNLHLFVGDSEETIVYAEGQLENVKEVISRQHEYVRDLFSSGMESVDMGEVVETEGFSLLYSELAFLVDEGLEDSKVRNDLMRAIDFMRLMLRDKNAYVYLERILNDLDVHLNDKKIDLFGVTEAYGNGSFKELEIYLKGE